MFDGIFNVRTGKSGKKELLRSKVPLYHRYMDNIIHLGKLELNLEDREMKSVDIKSLLGTLNTFE